MRTRHLGPERLEVSALGLGCMGMSEFYGATDETEAIATLHRALDLGVTLLETADAYGMGANERLRLDREIPAGATRGARYAVRGARPRESPPPRD